MRINKWALSLFKVVQGEALVLGEAVKIPNRIPLPLVEPRPRSDDPEPAAWWKKKRVANPPYDKAITGWRQQRMATLGGKYNGKNIS